MERWLSSRTVVVGIAMVLFVVCCVLPLGYLVTVSLTDVAAFPAMALDARQRGLLLNTALLGTGTACLATAIGAPLGLALARIALPRMALLRVALAAPALLPPYIAGLAWIYFGSSVGWMTALTGRDLLSAWTYSLPAAILVMSVVFYPVSMLVTEVAYSLDGGGAWMGIDYVRIHAEGDGGSLPTFTSTTLSGGNITINWTGTGTLESTPALGTAAAWAPVTPAPTGNTYTAPATTGNRFFRIRR